MQQIKSILIGWVETSRLCLSFNKVSWLFATDRQLAGIIADRRLWKEKSHKIRNKLLLLVHIYPWATHLKRPKRTQAFHEIVLCEFRPKHHYWKYSPHPLDCLPWSDEPHILHLGDGVKKQFKPFFMMRRGEPEVSDTL